MKTIKKQIKTIKKQIKTIKKQIKTNTKKLKKERNNIHKKINIYHFPHTGRVLHYYNPCLTSTTVLLLWKVGSIDERKNRRGISHFIEHMFFKGTERYLHSKNISNQIYRIGGNMNAYTSFDKTGYYITLPNEYLELGCQILSDMMYHSQFREKDIRDEKGVVIQENKKNDSQPVAYLATKFHETMCSNTPLQYNIGGLNRDLRRMTRKDILQYIRTYYRKKNRILCIASPIPQTRHNIRHLVNKYFSREITYDASPKHATISPAKFSKKGLISLPCHKIINRFGDLPQAHIFIGYRAYAMNDPRNYALDIISTILAGNMSSRLFIELREKYGLVYTVRSSIETFEQMGYFYIYAGTDNNAAKIEKVVNIIHREIGKLCDIDEGIREEELEIAKKYIITNIETGTAENVIFEYGDEYIIKNKITTREEQCKLFEEVNLQDIRQVIKELMEGVKYCQMILTNKKILTKYSK
jgi:predicted Zn-dependent peptidase